MTIDWWTLGFQTVNVAILIWLLGHFFWKPVAAMIEARRAASQKATEDAEAARAKAAAALADVELTRAGFANERQKILADAHEAADAARTALLAKAQTDADARLTAAQAAIMKGGAAQEAAWTDRSVDLAIDVAGRLAARLSGATVQNCFLDWLVQEIGRLSEQARTAAGANGMTLELVSAAALDAAARENCGKAIAGALKGNPQIGFRTDPALLAGFELRGDHMIVASSWRTDLATIRADLAK